MGVGQKTRKTRTNANVKSTMQYILRRVIPLKQTKNATILSSVFLLLNYKQQNIDKISITSWGSNLTFFALIIWVM